MRSAGTGNRTWLIPALRSCCNNPEPGAADLGPLIQPSALNPRDNAESLSGETVFGRATQVFAEVDGPNEIDRKTAVISNFPLQATAVHQS